MGVFRQICSGQSYYSIGYLVWPALLFGFQFFYFFHELVTVFLTFRKLLCLLFVLLFQLLIFPFVPFQYNFLAYSTVNSCQSMLCCVSIFQKKYVLFASS